MSRNANKKPTETKNMLQTNCKKILNCENLGHKMLAVNEKISVALMLVTALIRPSVSTVN